MKYLKREEGIFGEQMARTFGGNRFLLRARTRSMPPPSPRSAPYNGSFHGRLAWEHAPRRGLLQNCRACRRMSPARCTCP